MDDLASLVGRTFLARRGREAVAMIVEREALGWCYCKSLDLQSVARYPSDAVRREIGRQKPDEGRRMTTADAIRKLDELNEGPEEGHLEAEAILIQLMRENGLREVAEAFLRAKARCGFWYA